MSQLLRPARQVTGDPVQRLSALVVTCTSGGHARASQLCRVGDTELHSLSARAAAPGCSRSRDEVPGDLARHDPPLALAAGDFTVPDTSLAAMAMLRRRAPG